MATVYLVSRAVADETAGMSCGILSSADGENVLSQEQDWSSADTELHITYFVRVKTSSNLALADGEGLSTTPVWSPHTAISRQTRPSCNTSRLPWRFLSCCNMDHPA